MSLWVTASRYCTYPPALTIDDGLHWSASIVLGSISNNGFAQNLPKFQNSKADLSYTRVIAAFAMHQHAFTSWLSIIIKYHAVQDRHVKCHATHVVPHLWEDYMTIIVTYITRWSNGLHAVLAVPIDAYIAAVLASIAFKCVNACCDRS